RRQLLEKRGDRGERRARHPDPRRPGRRQSQGAETRTKGWSLRPCPTRVGNRLGQAALSTKTGIGRVGLRADQGEPRSEAVPTSRSISRVVRVEVANGHPQPPETPPT